jgi:tetratricopeptide (TPR) repeat protein
VLELHAIALQKAQGAGEFAVAMTDEQKSRFLQDIGDDIRQYKNMLATIDVERSDCSRHSDRESIHEGIRATVGFAQLSRMVFGVLEEWIRGQIETKALACAESGNYMQAMQWNEILGVMMEEHGLVTQAIAIQERLLDLKRRVLPKHHPNSAATVCNLATSYIAHGRLDEAVEILEEVVFGRNMPEHHEHLGTAINNLGVAYSELGRHADALAMRERALQFYRRNSPENDPQIGKAMNNLAHTYSNLGRLSDALCMQEKALQFYRRVLPENHPDVGMAISTLSLLYSKLGRHNEALELREMNLEARRRVLPENDTEIGFAMMQLGATYYNLQRYDDAVALLDKTLDFFRRVLPDNHSAIGDIPPSTLPCSAHF